MTIDEIKTLIENVATQQYNGSYRFLKPKKLTSIIGEDGVSIMREVISEELHEPYSLMIYCFMNDIYQPPICKCGERVAFNTTTKKFMKYCSNECKFDNIQNSVKIRQETNLIKYGHTNVLASEYGRNKIVSTNLEKYGVDNYTKTEEYKKSATGRKHNKQIK
jgi:hypothetical protein